ncbi:DUF3152 domain-containing protein [Actinocrispum sp. NPDC049592]|uniref:DUF3152 domain-containing protein n=1 Tax=Actinocrispum sp. NPDC049592 TaxID=3154835 RepID=UPI0034310287
MTSGGPATPPPKSRSAASRAANKGPQGRRDGDERYKRGSRRTSGEPLAAAWHPEDEAPESVRVRPVRRRGILSVYGWRLYAIPVLLVITALVVWDTSKKPAPDVQNASSPQNAVVSEGGPANGGIPEATEKAAVPPDLKVATAELPNGLNFTQAGSGNFRVIPGDGPKVGQGTQRTYKYTIEIEEGITAAEVGGGDDAFAGLVDNVLSNASQGWISDPRIAVQRVSANPDMRISLTTPQTTHKLCGLNIPYESSCRLAGKDGRVVINLARWVRGAVAFAGDMTTYRIYAINHEVGHAFGNGHQACGTDGALAPVMMQQTFGVSNDLVAKLNDAVPGSRDPVKPDGKVCRVNAWPNPQGK